MEGLATREIPVLACWVNFLVLPVASPRPVSPHPRTFRWARSARSKSAKSRLMHRSKKRSLFDHLVGGDEKPLRDVDAERFAVARWIASSKTVGRSTGRSAGFASLSILST